MRSAVLCELFHPSKKLIKAKWDFQNIVLTKETETIDIGNNWLNDQTESDYLVTLYVYYHYTI